MKIGGRNAPVTWVRVNGPEGNGARYGLHWGTGTKWLFVVQIKQASDTREERQRFNTISAGRNKPVHSLVEHRSASHG